ncbi:MAG: circadian clock protein KaiC [Syntrophotaleaceae bacterium]
MAKNSEPTIKASCSLLKIPTGIRGLDEVTGGGLPQGRPTLVCGGTGCGKTMFAMEFLLRGIIQFKEPGVFMSFEERPEELTANYASLGFDLMKLVSRKNLILDYVHIERSEIEETGDYDLEGLFIRLDHAINAIGAKRVVLDTIEALFSGLSNETILRAELRRLFRWLKSKGVTAVITGEKGERTLTRHGLEEYVADCVVFLDHLVTNQIATRRMRIIKYRGSSHGTNEYPFLIDNHGISVLPITSLSLDHPATDDRISTGIDRLDMMLGGQGFFRGSSILVSGTAGTGKTSLASQFVEAACRRGERALYFAFEESPRQIIRNMRSLGIDLEPLSKRGQLQFVAARPTLFGLEMHLVSMHNAIEEFRPDLVVVDPISNLITTGSPVEVRAMLTRLLDFLKGKQVTTLCTDLTNAGKNLEQTELDISSLMDTWLLLKTIEEMGERNRGLYILKSRGMAHSNQVREFVLSDKGLQLLDVYTGPGGVLTGAARENQELMDRAEEIRQNQKKERKIREMERKEKMLEAQITALRAGYEAEREELQQMIDQEKLESRRREIMTHIRQADQIDGENQTRQPLEKSDS